MSMHDKLSWEWRGITVWACVEMPTHDAGIADFCRVNEGLISVVAALAGVSGAWFNVLSVG